MEMGYKCTCILYIQYTYIEALIFVPEDRLGINFSQCLLKNAPFFEHWSIHTDCSGCVDSALGLPALSVYVYRHLLPLKIV